MFYYAKEKMKIAYLILAHTDPIQLKRLVLSLSGEEKYFFIHIDKKMDISKFKEELEGIQNVYWTNKRIFITWCGYSQTEAILANLEEMFKTNIKFERVLMLTGLDYPLKSSKEIENEFKNNPNKQYMIGFNISKCTTKKQIEKITYYHFRDLHIKNAKISSIISSIWLKVNHIIPLRKKIFTKEKDCFDIYMSSEYWALTYECVKELYDTYMKNEKLRKYLKTAFCPSEMFMPTLLFNSKFAKDATLFDSKEYTCLADLTLLHYIEYTSSIAIYDENDYEKLMNSGKMFVRKLVSGKSEKLIEMINEKADN